MRRKATFFIIVVLSIAQIACGQDTRSTLVFYAHAESLPPGNKGQRIEITFYPDGLIHTDRITDNGKTSVDVQIARHGNTIKPVYLQSNANQYYSIMSCTISGDQATIQLQGAKGEIDQLEIRRLSATLLSKTYEMDYRGKAVAIFVFDPAETELRIPPQGELYKYQIAHDARLPAIASSRGEDTYMAVLKTDGTVTIVRKTKEGMPVWSFSAKGQTFASNPLFAIFNYQLVDDGVVGVPIFPYIGGRPEQK